MVVFTHPWGICGLPLYGEKPDRNIDRNVERYAMAKIAKCRDVGLDCNFIARAETEEDVMKQIADHANTTHGVKDMPEEVIARVRSVIRDL
jgi:predicted small metal-binding protein